MQRDLSFAGNFVFHVDVPDGITSFTIRQSPVPVPASVTLALLGLLGLMVVGWLAPEAVARFSREQEMGRASTA